MADLLKGFTIGVLLTLTVVFGFVLYKGEGNLSEGLFNVANESATYYSETNYYITEQGQQKIDLAQLLLPYYATGTLATDCATGGGTWYQQSDKIGCWNYMAGGIDCGTAIVASATQQCQTVGGTAICNANNVGCYYP